MSTIRSTWLEVLQNKSLYSKLEKDEKTDVVIIGGGIAGITTAYTLASAGKRVIVIDKASLAESVTAYTTAFLTHIIDTDTISLMRDFGETKAKKILQGGEDAINFVEEIITKEAIACEFKRASYTEYATSQKNMEKLKQEAKASRDLGFNSVIHESNFLPFKNYGSIETMSQAKFHPIKYLRSLQVASEKLGVRFYDNTSASAISGGEENKPVIIETENHHVIHATEVVITTYNPFTQPLYYFTKKGMYKSYVYELSIPTGQIPEGTYADDKNPYHYFRIDTGMGSDGRDRMIVGGEDHRKSIPINEARNFHALENYVHEILGHVSYTIVRKWAGPILEPTDGIPLIGRYSKKYPNRFVASAFSGNGMTWGTLAAMIIRDLIIGEKNPYEIVFAPGRAFSLKILLTKTNDYVGEFIHGALKNFFVTKK